jgi:hypothetical protein
LRRSCRSVFVYLLTLLTLTLVRPGVGNASTLSFQDLYNPTDLLFTRTGLHSLEFTHDLAAVGFNPATDTLTAVTLSLYLHDSSDHAAEKVDIELDDLWFYNNETITSGSGPTRFTFQVMPLVSPDGMLKVLLSRQNGTFYFEQSLLDATGTRSDALGTDVDRLPDASASATAMPEPASLVLLGSGLVAVSFVLRFRRRSES